VEARCSFVNSKLRGNPQIRDLSVTKCMHSHDFLSLETLPRDPLLAQADGDSGGRRSRSREVWNTSCPLIAEEKMSLHDSSDADSSFK